MSKKLTIEQKTLQAKDLTDNNWWVRRNAVMLGSLTPEQHQAALADISSEMRMAAIGAGGLTKQQLTAALGDVDYAVRRAAVKLGGLTANQQYTALADSCDSVYRSLKPKGDTIALQLTPYREDYWAVLGEAPGEIAGLRLALVEGRVEGRLYAGDCACLVGTIANLRGINVCLLPEAIKPNAARPAERWFYCIQSADTPETNYASKMAVEWLDEFVSRHSTHKAATA